MEDNNTIIFRMGDETGIVIEKTKEQFKHSLFKEQYKQAFSLIDGILSRTSKARTSDEIDENISNVIAFCGDRGEGKTSALETVRGILFDEDIFREAKDAELFPKEIKKLNSNSFKVLKLIDPAFFDHKHNLLELLLGQMYSEVKLHNAIMAKTVECDELCSSGELVKHKNLVKYFQKVRTSLAIINKASEKNAYDNLEEIDELAAGIELKENLRCLLKLYADYFHKDRVLICIDDLDLNISEGYKMAEEIRKYLSSPSACIVMMAIKAEQIEEVVQSYLRENTSKIIVRGTITDMANRYVTKLLPQGNRVWMPKGESVVERKVQLYNGEKLEDEYTSVKDAVVKLIYRKTRYVFVNGRNLSPIVPTNLRSIRHLMGLLWEMSDISRDEITPANTTNKVLFKNYFYYTWADLLRDDDQRFIKEFVANEDLTSLNKSVVQHLNGIFEKRYSKSEKSDGASSLLTAIVDNRNTIYNVSVGDVMYMVRYMESIATDKQDLYFLFFIKAFYSIKLYETYDFITSDEKNLFVEPESNETAKYIYKYDKQIQKMNQLQRLLNGSYFTYVPGTLLPAERDMRKINGNQLVKLIQSLPAKAADCVGKKRDILRLCEFFVLTTSRPLYSGELLEYDRKRKGRGYFEAFNKNNSIMSFDALSIFYNVVNIRYTYQRWNEICNATDFYEYAKAVKNTKEAEGSLLNQIFAEHAVHYKDPAGEKLGHELHSFLSDAVIRISDIIFSILENAESQKDVHGKGDNAKNIYYLYNDIQSIGITLYPISKDDNGYPLPFDFLSPIKRLLDNNELKNVFDAVFEREGKLRNEDIYQKLTILFESLLSGAQIPNTGTFIVKFIEKGYPELYKSYKTEWWKNTFNLDSDRTYERVKDLVDVIKKKPARSKKLIDVYEKNYGEIKIEK